MPKSCSGPAHDEAHRHNQLRLRPAGREARRTRRCGPSRLVVNDWQVAGVALFDSGAPYTLGYSYNSGPTGQALTGSPNYSARIVLDDVNALGSGCSERSVRADQEHDGRRPEADRSSTALSGPQVGSVGLESGRNYLTGCKNHMMDLAIQRTIRLGGGRAIDLRVDMYNVFNR